MKQLFAAVILFAFCTASIAAAEEGRPPFRPALDAHLAAIAAKDLDAYKPTVTKGDDLHIVFPGGEVMHTTEEVIAFHEGWFQDPNWRWDGEVLKIIEGEDLSAAFMRYDYRDTPEGEPRSAWLLLLFALEDGEWRLVHDQNTRIPAPAENESN